MEKLVEKLKDMIAKEQDTAIRVGLRLALLEVYTEWNNELKYKPYEIHNSN